MRRALLTFLLALLATPVFAGPAEFDIQLGKEPPAPKPTEPAKIKAVERFLAARQDAGRDAKQRAEARALIAAKVEDAELFGPKDAPLLAYDFHDRSLEPAGPGAFSVPVYLLFATKEGVVLESRDEMLTFTARGNGYVCTSVKTTGSMLWDEGGVIQTADRFKADDALAHAENVLHGWAVRQRTGAAFSVTDFYRLGDGRFRVHARCFTVSAGGRGFDAQDSTLILVRDGEGYRVDPN